MTLIEFLRARLDEDEQVAQNAYVVGNERPAVWSMDKLRTSNSFGVHDDRGNCMAVASGDRISRHMALHGPDRVMREVAAKRKILAQYESVNATATYPDSEGGRANGLEEAVYLLAEAYSDHADYRPEWAA